MALTKQKFKETLSKWASGVTVITTRSSSGIHAMTATSFTSLSLDPPLIMLAVNKSNRTHQYIKQQQKFAVIFLNQEQRNVSDLAAGFSGEEGNSLPTVDWHESESGTAILSSNLAWLDCMLHAEYEGGDHTIFVGRVVETGVGSGDPLLWYERGYRKMAD